MSDVWLIFGIISVIAIWLNPFIEKKIEARLKVSLKPNVNVEIQEKSESQFILTVQSTHKNTIIKTLSLKFSIPGVFLNYKNKTLDRVGKCNIRSSFKMGIGETTTTETAHVWCENLSPNSFLKTEINYKPTTLMPVPGSEKAKHKMMFMPVMDLHDYSKCTYTWTFKGEELTETQYISLKDLECVKKDNENLLYHWQGIEFEKYIKKYKPDFINRLKSIYTKEWLENLEKSRKDW